MSVDARAEKFNIVINDHRHTQKCDFFCFPADLVTFTEEIFNGKLHSLCNDIRFDGLSNTVNTNQ